MGNAVAADDPSSCSCTCNDSRQSGEVHFNTYDRGVYPHAGMATMDEKASFVPNQETPAVKNAQETVKNFVRALVKGQEVELLSVNGGTARCMAYLDRKLTTLSLQRGIQVDAKRRSIPLEDIEEVLVGEDGGADFDLDTDELCVTLVLRSHQALGFSFRDMEDRDTFALCLTMFIDGLHAKEPRRA
mmetsp:Transcript_118238/g.329770  ORF Transcript_118238/g.329770 Transcript_118238/m.329770 type:complete len:187 (-) Transcript_118238:115-675(-)